MLVYEFPLNEKSRTYLRFNSLFEQLDANREVSQTAQALAFFKALFDFIELSERCDIRSDLMKDLEKQRQKIDAWRGQQSRERTRLRRPELYEQWCETHPLTEIPKWKRGENVRLVKTAEQMEAAAKLFAEGRRSICAGGWVQEALDALTPEMFLPQLQQEKQEGWVCYLHYTKDVPDATVSVHHKTGQVEHLFVTESARGRGIGQKMLDFARKKLPEHEHPVLTVLNTNTRALALYRRMGWQVVGAKEKFDPAKDPLVVRPSQVLEMRYQG